MNINYPFEITNKNNNTLSDALPKINLSSTVLQTSPNIASQKTINNYIQIPKICKSPLNETVKKIKIFNKRYKPNKAIDMIHKLNIESNFRETFLEELKKREKREKIISNQEIIERRLGLFKKNDIYSEEEKNKERDIKNFKDISIEKLNYREKEKKLEKNYKKSLNDLEILDKKLSDLELNIRNLGGVIDGHKLEMNVLDQYGQKIDKKNIALESPVKSKLEKLKKTPLVKKKDSDKNLGRRSSLVKDSDFEMQAKLLVKRYKRDEIGKQIQSKVNDNKKILENMLKENEDLKEQYNNKKKKINELKNELINIYHTTLFEGLDFRGEGLARIILNIWNLGGNIDMNFIPTYLDNKSIEYLFKKARQIVDMAKVKKLVNETEKDFIDHLKQWKIDNHLNTNSNKKLKNYFFKTRVFDDDNEENSFLDYYPMTKLFMNNYKKSLEKNNFEEGEIKNNKMSFKTLDIPNSIIEKNNKIIMMKNKQQILKNQIEMDKKNEVIRLCKEFLFNNYQQKYKVCIDTVIGALFGEINKDDMLNLYYSIKKENKDNLKKIEFYSPLSDRIKNK